MTEAAGAARARADRRGIAGQMSARVQPSSARPDGVGRRRLPQRRGPRLPARTARPSQGLEEILDRVRGMPRDDIEREHVGHPDVDGPAREVYEELISGRGLVVVRGFPVEEHTRRGDGAPVLGVALALRSARVEQLLRSPDGAGAAGGAARRRAAGAWHEVGGRAGDAQRRRRHLLAAVDPPGRARAARASSRADPPRTTRILATRPDMLADPLPRVPAPPSQRAARRPAGRDALRRADLLQTSTAGSASTSPTAASCPRCTSSAASSRPRRRRRSNILRRVLVRAAGRAAHASRATRRWRTTSPCATRAPTSSTVPTRSAAGCLLRAWTEVPLEDRRLPDRARVLPHGEQGWAPRVRPGPGREGRIAINDYSNVDEDLADLFKAAQAKPKVELTRCVRPRLVYFDQWTDPVAGRSCEHGGCRRRRSRSRAPSTRTGRRWNARTATSRSSAPSWPATRASPSSGSAAPSCSARARDLLAVCSAGAGYDVIDVDACTAAGVIVCNNSGPGREAVAEHALGFMLDAGEEDLARRPHDPARDRAGPAARCAAAELLGKTLGVVGRRRRSAAASSSCARRSRWRCWPSTRTCDEDEPHARGATKVELDELLERSDFVQLNCPLTPETEGLIGREQFAAMKPTAFFITTARGPVHDEAALYDALVGGTIAGAGIDVFHDEPPRPDRPVAARSTTWSRARTPRGSRSRRRATSPSRPPSQWITIFAGKRATPTDQPRGVAGLLRPIPCPLRRAARGASAVTTSPTPRAPRCASSSIIR